MCGSRWPPPAAVGGASPTSGRTSGPVPVDRLMAGRRGPHSAHRRPRAGGRARGPGRQVPWDTGRGRAASSPIPHLEWYLMIAATGLELRAGAQLLLADASFQIAAGRQDRPGRPQRRRQDHPGQGARRRGDPRGGQRPAHASIGYLPQDPRTGDLEGLARDRVLSGRGLDELRAAMRAAEEQMPTGSPPAATPRSAATASWRNGSPCSAATRRRPRPRRSAPTSACPTGCSPSRSARCPAASAAGSSWPGSCSPTRRRCCWTSRPTTWTPTRSPGCAIT